MIFFNEKTQAQEIFDHISRSLTPIAAPSPFNPDDLFLRSDRLPEDIIRKNPTQSSPTPSSSVPNRHSRSKWLNEPTSSFTDRFFDQLSHTLVDNSNSFKKKVQHFMQDARNLLRLTPDTNQSSAAAEKEDEDSHRLPMLMRKAHSMKREDDKEYVMKIYRKEEERLEKLYGEKTRKHNMSGNKAFVTPSFYDNVEMMRKEKNSVELMVHKGRQETVVRTHSDQKKNRKSDTSTNIESHSERMKRKANDEQARKAIEKLLKKPSILDCAQTHVDWSSSALTNKENAMITTTCDQIAYRMDTVRASIAYLSASIWNGVTDFFEKVQSSCCGRTLPLDPQPVLTSEFFEYEEDTQRAESEFVADLMKMKKNLDKRWEQKLIEDLRKRETQDHQWDREVEVRQQKKMENPREKKKKKIKKYKKSASQILNITNFPYSKLGLAEDSLDDMNMDEVNFSLEEEDMDIDNEIDKQKLTPSLKRFTTLVGDKVSNIRRISIASTAPSDSLYL